MIVSHTDVICFDASKDPFATLINVSGVSYKGLFYFVILPQRTCFKKKLILL